MVVLFVLFAAWLAFRGAGALGVGIFATWHDCARYALAVMFVFTGISHFTRMKQDFVKMLPSFVPQPMAIIYLTGVLEFLGAIGLLLPRFERWAALGLIGLLIAMFPANVKAALQAIPLRGKSPTPLWLRAPMQVLFIALLWWSTKA